MARYWSVCLYILGLISITMTIIGEVAGDSATWFWYDTYGGGLK